MQSITRNRKLDTYIFLVLLVILVAYSPKMRVYYQGHPCEVKVVSVGADDSRTELELPPEFLGSHTSISKTASRIVAFAETEEGKQLAGDGVRLEWELADSADSRWRYKSRTLVTNQRDE